MSVGNVVARLGMLRHRINEKRPMNIEDVCLVEEAQAYIKRLEDRVAVLQDMAAHWTEDRERDMTLGIGGPAP